MEADLWLDGADLGVSHDGAPFKGSLRALYLDPLAARLAANGGSVHGDGKPFFLWLDLKQGSAALQDVLATQLAGYAFLTRFDGSGEVQPGAVTVVLTGDDAARRRWSIAPRRAPTSATATTTPPPTSPPTASGATTR